MRFRSWDGMVWKFIWDFDWSRSKMIYFTCKLKYDHEKMGARNPWTLKLEKGCDVLKWNILGHAAAENKGTVTYWFHAEISSWKFPLVLIFSNFIMYITANILGDAHVSNHMQLLSHFTCNSVTEDIIEEDKLKSGISFLADDLGMTTGLALYFGQLWWQNPTKQWLE